VIGAVSLVFPIYVSGYYNPMGGDVPGPRFLIATLPFLAIGLAPAYRRFPLLSLTFALISTVPMILATATQPMLGNDNTTTWLDLVRAGDFTNSVVTLGGGGHGWPAILPFIGAIAIAVVATVVDGWHEVGPVRRDLPRALAGLVVWALVCTAAPDLLRIDRASGAFSGLAAVFLLAIAAVAAVPLAPRHPWIAALGAGGLAGAAALSHHSRWALIVGMATVATVAIGSLRMWRSDRSRLVPRRALGTGRPEDRAIA
jgi:hypothetical protein